MNRWRKVPLTILRPRSCDKKAGSVSPSEPVPTTYQVNGGANPWSDRGCLGQTINTLGALFHSKQAGVGVKDLSGPPGISRCSPPRSIPTIAWRSFSCPAQYQPGDPESASGPSPDGGHILLAVIERVAALSVRFMEYDHRFRRSFDFFHDLRFITILSAFDFQVVVPNRIERRRAEPKRGVRRSAPAAKCAMRYCQSPFSIGVARAVKLSSVIGPRGRDRGGDHPVVVQSMLTCDTMDTACVQQTLDLVVVGTMDLPRRP